MARKKEFDLGGLGCLTVVLFGLGIGSYFSLDILRGEPTITHNPIPTIVINVLAAEPNETPQYEITISDPTPGAIPQQPAPTNNLQVRDLSEPRCFDTVVEKIPKSPNEPAPPPQVNTTCYDAQGNVISQTNPAPEAPATRPLTILPTPDTAQLGRDAEFYTIYQSGDVEVTQGYHSQDQGELAIDIAAGPDTPLFSPIYGTVTSKEITSSGSPVLIIENSVYIVTLVHAHFTANVGDQVTPNTQIGTEGNLGYVTDMHGIPCGDNPNCGYHTHLSIMDHNGNHYPALDMLDLTAP